MAGKSILEMKNINILVSGKTEKTVSGKLGTVTVVLKWQDAEMANYYPADIIKILAHEVWLWCKPTQN